MVKDWRNAILVETNPLVAQNCWTFEATYRRVCPATVERVRSAVFQDHGLDSRLILLTLG